MVNLLGLDNDQQNLNANGRTEYQELRFQLIVGNEAFIPTVYDDGVGIPTLGFGFALREANNRAAIAGVVNGVTAAQLDNINTQLTNLFAQARAQTDAQGNFFVFQTPGVELPAGSTALPMTNPLFQQIENQINLVGAITQGQGNQIFNTIINDSENLVPTAGARGVDFSVERAALVSVAFNAGTSSPSARQAIEDDDRAEAWYEIRYNAHDGATRLNNGVNQGIANRRYVESHVFRLYEGPQNDPYGATLNEVETEDALKVFRTFNKHENNIRAFDTSFEAGITTARATADELTANLPNLDFQSVQGRDASFELARRQLINEFANFEQNFSDLLSVIFPEAGYSGHLTLLNMQNLLLNIQIDDTLSAALANASLRNVFVAASERGALPFVAGQLGIGAEVDPFTVDRTRFGVVDEHDLIFGSIEEAQGNFLGVVASVNDTLRGGGGNDFFVGGGGSDVIDGGDGEDTASYLSGTIGVTVDLENNNATGAFANSTDTLMNIENVIGTNFNDTFTGVDNSANIFIGAAGVDTFNARGGGDIYIGGTENDIVNVDAVFTEGFIFFGGEGPADDEDHVNYGAALENSQFSLTGSFAQGIGNRIDVTRAGITDTLYNVEVIDLSANNKTITYRQFGQLQGQINVFTRQGQNNIRIEEGPNTNQPVLNILNESQQAGNGLLRIDFDAENDPNTNVHFLTIANDVQDQDRGNAVLTFNGRQLIGGAAFDFNRFELQGGALNAQGRHDPAFSDRTFDTILIESDWVRYRAENLQTVFDFFQPFVDVNSNTGIPTLPGLGLAFNFVGLALASSAASLVTEQWASYSSIYQQIILGAHGESYAIFNSVEAAENTNRLVGDVFAPAEGVSYVLRIQIDPDDTQADQFIIIENWQQGDFGINLVAPGLGHGFDTGTNRNGEFDLIFGSDGFSDAQIQGTLRGLGLVPEALGDEPPIGGPQTSAVSNATTVGPGDPFGLGIDLDLPITRNGNNSNNILGGTAGDDMLNGGGGDDQLSGGEGQDTYVFEAGDGADVITDASAGGNTITFLGGINLDDVTQEEVLGDDGALDLLVTYGAGDTILIKDWSLLDQTTRDAWVFDTIAPPPAPPQSEEDVENLVVYPTELTGDSDANNIIGGDLNDIIIGNGGDDTLVAGGGDDEVFGDAGNDLLAGGNGNDRVLAGDGDDTIDPGINDDFVDTGSGADFIFASGGNDTIVAGDGGNTFRFDLGGGNDRITVNDSFGGFFGGGPQNTDTLIFGAGITPEDILLTRTVDNPNSITLNIQSTGESVTILNQFNFDDSSLSSGNIGGFDEILFDNGAAWGRQDLIEIYISQASTDGNDVLVGFDDRDDVLLSSAGDDTIAGATGSDDYLWIRGSGNDLIIDNDDFFSDINESTRDRLVFGPNISPDDVTLIRNFSDDRAITDSFNGTDLTIIITGSGGGSVTLQDYFDDEASGVDLIVFEDGTTWDRSFVSGQVVQAQITDEDNIIPGTGSNDSINALDGDDSVVAQSGDDIINGQAGNDTLQGQGGNDTIDGGLGDDLIVGGRNDADVFVFGANFGRDRVEVETQSLGDTVFFTASSLSDYDIFYDELDETLVWQSVTSTNRLELLDHASLDIAQNRNDVISFYQFQDGEILSLSEIVTYGEISNVASNILSGDTTSQILFGTNLSDKLLGLAGDDTVTGGAGNDIVNGGTGNDSLSGGIDNDGIVGGWGDDTLAGDQGDDILFGGGNNDIVGGGAGDDSLFGGSGDDTLFGGSGDDELTGGLGDDVYRFSRGDGQDTIDATDGRSIGDNEGLIFNSGISQNSVEYSLLRDDLIINFSNGTIDQLTITDFLGAGNLFVEFADGTRQTATDILREIAGATDGADNPAEVSIGSGRTLIYGGLGDDTLAGTGSDNTFLFTRGDGRDTVFVNDRILLGPSDNEILIFGYTEEQVNFAASGTDLVVTFDGTDDVITVDNHFGFQGTDGRPAIDAIRFEGGQLLGLQAIRERVTADQATDGNDLITAAPIGLAGELDRLTGGLGDDTLLGGANRDVYTYELGGGSDVINDTEQNTGVIDRLEFGEGIVESDLIFGVSDSNPLDVTITLPNGETLTLVGQLAGDGRGIEEIQYANGSTSGSANVRAFAIQSTTTDGDDNVVGTVQDETLTGGAGDDTLAGGDGNDTYILGTGSDTVIDSMGNNVAEFEQGVSLSDLLFAADPENSDDLLITLQSGDVIRVQGQFAGAGIDSFRFSDGTILNRDGIAANALAASQTDGDDVLTGARGNDLIEGGGGNDTIDAGLGSDIIVFGRDDGNDIIVNSAGETGRDIILLGDDIDVDEVALTIGGASGADLIVSLRTSDSTLTIENYFDVSGPEPLAVGSINQIAFADGTVWTMAEILQRAIDTAPIVNATLDDQVVSQDQEFSLTLDASLFADVEDSEIIIEASLSNGEPLPQWLSFDGTLLSGTPSNDDVTNLEIVITARDSAGGFARVPFTLSVTNVNDAPEASAALGSVALSVGSMVNYVVDETLFSDPDDLVTGTPSALSFSARLADGSPLPAWLSFNETTRSFTGTVPASTEGALSIIVQVSDGTALLEAPLTFGIGADGTAPTVDAGIATQNAVEDIAFEFTLPTNVFADQTPDDRLILSARLSDGSPLPAWLSFNSATSTFSGLPENSDAGILDIELIATDAFGNSIATNFQLDVANTNDAPTAIGILNDVTSDEGQDVNLVIDPAIFADEDVGDTLTITAALAGGVTLPDWLSFDGQRFVGIPEDADVGFYQFEITATDGSGESVTITQNLFVRPVNDAPIVTVDPLDQSVTRDEEFIFTIASDTFVDVDSGGFAVEARLSNGDPLPDWINFDPTTFTFAGTPNFRAVGTFEGRRDFEIEVIATDGDGEQAVAAFTVTAIGPNPGEDLIGTAGNETIIGTDGPDTIDGGAGDDTLIGNRGDDIYLFGQGSGNDVIDPDILSTSVDSIDGTIRVVGGLTLSDLTLSRSGSNSVTSFMTDLVVTINATGETLTVEQQFADLSESRNVITAIEFDDGTILDAGNILDLASPATAGNDEIAGDSFDNELLGGDGNDSLYGLGGTDILEGGPGNDVLFGGADPDRYRLNIGDGNDRIIDSANSNSDRLLFGPGITTDDLVIIRNLGNPNDPTSPPGITLSPGELYIGLRDGSASVVIEGQYESDNGITRGLEGFQFDDGTLISIFELEALADNNNNLTGTGASETLTAGFDGAIFNGLGGDDTLVGGFSDDVYLWSPGDGSDIIIEDERISFDRIVLGGGVTRDDVVFERGTGLALDLSIRILSTDEIIEIEQFFDATASTQSEFFRPIDEIEFSDGEIITFSQIFEQQTQGAAGDDSLVGFEFNDDTFDGGAGNDTLRGFGDNDTYIFGRGYGNDIIIDSNFNIFNTDNNDRIQFIDGLTPDDILISRSSPFSRSDFVFTIRDTGDSIALTSGIDDRQTDWTFRFDNGVVLNERQIVDLYFEQNSTDGNDLVFSITSGFVFNGNRIIETGLGNDTLFAGDADTLLGGEGDDVYVIGRGQVSLIDEQNNISTNDEVRLDDDFGDNDDQTIFRTAPNGVDLHILRGFTFNGQLNFIAESPSVIIRDFFTPGANTIELVTRSNGESFTRADILANLLSSEASENVINGTADADDLSFEESFLQETFIGGTGDDTLTGGDRSSDLYIWAPGDGNDTIFEGADSSNTGINIYPDTLQLNGVNPSDVLLVLNGTNLEVLHEPTGELITISNQYGNETDGILPGIEEIVFDDGTIWTRQFIDSRSAIFGTLGNDTLTGTSAEERFNGRTGDDVFNTASGNDTFLYASGDGNDTINDTNSFSSTTDILFLTDLSREDVEFGRVGNDLLVTDLTNGQVITIVNEFRSSRGVEFIQFADDSRISRADILQNLTLRGTSGDDNISGGSSGETIIGEAGNDTLSGGSGSDIYIFNIGDGADFVNDTSTSTTNIDRLVLGDGILPSDITASRTDNGNDLVLMISANGDQVTVNSQFSSLTQGLEQVEFADGTIWNRQFLVAISSPATAGDDLIEGDISDNDLSGLAGNDTLDGDTGSDTLSGNDGNDSLNGEAGNDDLSGNAGDDTLTGGDGVDIYRFARGDGQDVINDGGATLNELDQLVFAGDIRPTDVTVTRSSDGEDFILSINGGSDQVILQDRLISGTAGVDLIAFADGTVWNFDALLDLSSGAALNPPVAVDDTLDIPGGTNEFIILITELLANDGDPDGDSIFVLTALNPSVGTVRFNGLGDIVVDTETVLLGGQFTLEYTLSDGLLSDIGTITVNVTAPPNIPPVANGDSGFVTDENVALNILANDLLSNDTDDDDDSLTIVAVQDAINGAVELDGSGNVLFTPDDGYFGPASFTYTISDGLGGGSTALVSLDITEVNSPPVAVDDNAATGIITPVSIDVLANDSDEDGNPLTITSVSSTSNGTVVIDDNGTSDPSDDRIIYTPNGGAPAGTVIPIDTGFDLNSDGFSYVDDLFRGTSNPAYASGVFDPVGGDTGGGLTVSVGAIDNATITDISGGWLTNFTLAQVGSTTFTFSYRAQVSADFEANEFVQVLAAVDGVLLGENGNDFITQITGDGNGGIAPDSGWVTVTLDLGELSAGNHTLALGAFNNQKTFNNESALVSFDDVLIRASTEATNAFAGTDTFTYTIEDGRGGSSSATVTVTVDDTPPPNTAPDAMDDGGFVTDEDMATTIAASDLLSNDSDADGDTLSILSVQDGVNGTVMLDVNGDIVFTPDAGFFGAASFTYTVSDGNGGEDTATVSLTVNEVVPPNTAPDAMDDGGFVTDEDMATTIAASDLLSNDSDADGDTLSILSVQDGVNGTVMLDVNGDIVFTPDAGFFGDASFTYTVSDGNGGEDTATVSLIVNEVVPPNTAPDAMDDGGFVTDEDMATTIAASDLLSNDSDADGDTLSILSVQDGVNGTVMLDVNGDIVFTPDAGFFGAASFTYTVSDGNGGEDTATVSLTVNEVVPPNTAPDAMDDGGFVTDEDMATTIAASDLLSNDSDADGDTLSILSVQDGVNGTVMLDVNGDIVFTPDAG
ncbi:MAG: cadherin-like domain-containing protein, partial [Pseudomonadota bacterium]